jgi:ParB family transcriptional regulator, chromosome partitioning protein
MKHDTNQNGDLPITDIDVGSIKFFVRRSRSKGAYSRLKESIRELGLKQPIHVKDISGWPPSDRARPGGGHYKYELICGQGRLQAFRELGWGRIPAMVIDVAENEIVGRFLAENVMRRQLSWYDKAQLVKRDVDAGMDIDTIREKYFVTTGQVYKYLRILRQASGKLLSESEIEKLSMNQAEELTSVDAETQEIVVEVLKEEQLNTSQIKSLVKKAKRLGQEGTLSKISLKQSLRDLQKALKEIHNRLKTKRLHWTLGPYNLKQVLQDIPELKKALEDEGIDYLEFLKATSTGV